MSEQDTSDTLNGVKEYTFHTEMPPDLPNTHISFLTHKLHLRSLYGPDFAPHALFGSKLSWLFALVIITNCLINIDHGILPAITTTLQE